MSDQKELYDDDESIKKLSPEIRRAKIDVLRLGYTPVKRFSDITWTFLAAIVLPLATYNLLTNIALFQVPLVFVGFLFGVVFSDFASGIVHWGADTWGTIEVPFFGSFIRNFRQHHLSPTAMIDHDFFETNGDNCLLVDVPLLYFSMINMHKENWEIFNYSFWIGTAVAVALTNQFHKWAHDRCPPSWVVFLQKNRIILPKDNHLKHHQGFGCNYCITTGWLNPVLEYINFWRHFERFISMITGHIPREDDLKWTGVDGTPDVVKKFMSIKNKN